MLRLHLVDPCTIFVDRRQLFTAVFEMADDTFHRERDALLEIASPPARIRAGIRLFVDVGSARSRPVAHPGAAASGSIDSWVVARCRGPLWRSGAAGRQHGATSTTDHTSGRR